MLSPILENCRTPDETDRGLIHALYVDARAPFSQIGSALGVSTQTVARRYQSLRVKASLRVLGLPHPQHAHCAEWLIRLTVSPSVSRDVALALSRRADTSWVSLVSGGAEIVAIVQAPITATSAETLLARDVPRTAGVTGVSAHRLLHLYLGRPAVWRGYANVLDDHQQKCLRPRWLANPGQPSCEPVLTGTDVSLLAALREDGRASYADLAAATGRSPATVARRLEFLRASGSLYFEVDMDPAAFGISTRTFLWMEVAPDRLDQVAMRLSGHEETVFVAATTGRSSLVADVLCPDPDALHHFLTRFVGKLDGIRSVESAPVSQTVKRAGSLSMAPARYRAPSLSAVRHAV
ncbi:MAG TPA: AsnC family transcriptional regulator [Streptosporangiaceae bacterium]|jgi:DNA-binding Lrp family transcriptional regulator|nr:AsnC family transcriptional regulator [Streptosporangiaceae bacterium]